MAPAGARGPPPPRAEAPQTGLAAEGHRAAPEGPAKLTLPFQRAGDLPGQVRTAQRELWQVKMTIMKRNY